MIIGKIKILPLSNNQNFKDRESYTHLNYVDCVTDDGFHITGILNNELFKEHKLPLMMNHMTPTNYYYATAEVKNFNPQNTEFKSSNLFLSIKKLEPCQKDSPNMNLFSIRGLAIKCSDELEPIDDDGSEYCYISTIACNKVIAGKDNFGKPKKDIKKTYVKIKSSYPFNKKDDIFGTVKIVPKGISKKLILENIHCRADSKYKNIVAEHTLL